MIVAGIAAEYNPFHNGHRYHIEETRRLGATHVAVVMSGHFMQRGEPSLLLKWNRARAALLGGADLVLELPAAYSLSSAEGFARGAAGVLSALGCVDMMSFGAETDDISLLRAAADAVASPEIHSRTGTLLQQGGLSYPAAREQAVLDVFGETLASVLRSPNNILAVEYLKALRLLHSPIRPFAVARKGSAHDAPGGAFSEASASYIRGLLRCGEDISPFVPESTLRVLRSCREEGTLFTDPARYELAVLSRLRGMTAADFALLPDIAEGLENRMEAAVLISTGLEELYDTIKTKRYTHSRIRRLVACAFLGVARDMARGTPPYIRVLGFNGRGQEILKKAKESARLPLVLKYSDLHKRSARARETFALECRATDQYALLLPRTAPCGLEMTSEIVRVE